MDLTFQGNMPDPEKCSKLSMEEKRKLVHQLTRHPNAAPDMLQSWSRQEILQILCAEMGKERKYTGLTKLKMIENLLKIVSDKNSAENSAIAPQQMLSNSAIYCKNSACKASLSREGMFCKRCSCCICRKFDENKDPSLWLTCCSDPPFEGKSCGISCHLECALRHERSGLAKDGKIAQLDGSFYCVSCGKMNDLLRCWRKQLSIAKETRRVDILCYRVSLSQKLLCGTNKYQKLSDIVDEAVNKLQAEVGNLTGKPMKTGRGIVNRLSTGKEVRRLCASAVQLLDSMLGETTTIQILAHPVVQDSKALATNTMKSEDICATTRCLTEMRDPGDNEHSPESLVCEATSTDNCPETPTRTRLEIIPCTPLEMGLPNSSKKGEDHAQVRSSPKKRNREGEGLTSDRDLEFYMKMIRRLETEGLIEKSFRQKLLTWFGFRATQDEMRVVKVFVDVLRDDPVLLAEQLMDAFEEAVSSERSTVVVPSGFCMKLWH